MRFLHAYIIILGMLLLPFLSEEGLAQTYSGNLYDDEIVVVSEDPVLPDLSSGRWPVARWSLKTNGLIWLATIPNITGEVRVSDHVALDLGLWWCPWRISDKRSLKIFSIQPEGRWWLNKEGTGHYFDLHLTCAWFNLRWGASRYQDVSRPLLGAGIGYGYRFRFNENWGLELSVGAGYMNMRYNTFYNIANGALIDTRQTSYWGIDRAGVSLVYMFSP